MLRPPASPAARPRWCPVAPICAADCAARTARTLHVSTDRVGAHPVRRCPVAASDLGPALVLVLVLIAADVAAMAGIAASMVLR